MFDTKFAHGRFMVWFPTAKGRYGRIFHLSTPVEEIIDWIERMAEVHQQPILISCPVA
jgi:hypothetical protein